MPPPRTPYELAERGVEALIRELGPADTVRFIRIAMKGSGDYTVDRIVWLAGLTVEDMLADIQRMRDAGLLRPPTHARVSDGISGEE